MRIYSFGCDDGIANAGHAVVEVIDYCMVTARQLANAHLIEVKRAELIPHLSYTGNRPVPDRGVSYSNVRPQVV